MSLRGPVLAAINLTEAADETLRQASGLASSLNTTLTVCHVLPETLRVRMLFPHRAAVDPATQAAHERGARDAVQAITESVTGRPPGGFEVALDSGSPHAGILAQAERLQAGVLVVGPGSVADRVARYAPWPVLVARTSPPGAVLGATDFSDPAMPAIEAAVAEAARRGVALRVIHCLDLDRPVGVSTAEVGIAPALPQSVIDDLDGHARQHLADTLAGLHATGDCLVVRGLAALCIVEAAREVPTELIVVGTRGRTSLPRLLLGSVAETVLSAAPCSVLVVPLHPGGAAA
jgi:universal stress protein E